MIRQLDTSTEANAPPVRLDEKEADESAETKTPDGEEDDNSAAPEWVIDKLLQEGVDFETREPKFDGITSVPSPTHGNPRVSYHRLWSQHADAGVRKGKNHTLCQRLSTLRRARRVYPRPIRNNVSRDVCVHQPWPRLLKFRTRKNLSQSKGCVFQLGYAVRRNHNTGRRLTGDTPESHTLIRRDTETNHLAGARR